MNNYNVQKSKEEWSKASMDETNKLKKVLRSLDKDRTPSRNVEMMF